jgi:MFS superfamily sulfate permease-like transporter
MLVGFLTGVGIEVAAGQVPGMLGVSGGGGRPLSQLGHALGNVGHANGAAVAVSASVLLVLVGGERVAPKLPWALLTVIGAIVASTALDLAAHGVATLGPIPGGLPSFGIPDAPVSAIPDLAGAGLSMFVVILAQSAATSRAYASKFRDAFDEDSDLLGLSAANLSAGLTGTFVVNGSPTKTEMVDSAGGRSQLAQLSSAAAALLVLLFLTGPLSHLPIPALSAIVFVIALRLVDLRGMSTIRRLRPVEFWVAVTTAVVVVFIGVEQGILLAIALSVIVHLRHSYRPHDRLLYAEPNHSWRTATVEAGVQARPGLVIYRFSASLYYANARRFEDELTTLADTARPRLRWLCLACDAIEDVDYSGSLTLREVHGELARRDVTLVLCGVPDQVRAELDRDGFTQLVGAGHVFPWPDDVVRAYDREARS